MRTYLEILRVVKYLLDKENVSYKFLPELNVQAGIIDYFVTVIRGEILQL
jgi:hypothetical protein